MINLTSQIYFDFTKPILDDGVVKTFIHKSCELKTFIDKMLSHTENLINVDFKIVGKQKNAELKFFEIKSFEDNPTYLGLAVPSRSPIGNIWDIYVKSITSYSKRWLYLHEFGHFLGMGHPHDNDVVSNETTSDTVMSYNYEVSPYWWFRQSDIDTITGMWANL
jgi:hypothetical protein